MLIDPKLFSLSDLMKIKQAQIECIKAEQSAK